MPNTFGVVKANSGTRVVGRATLQGITSFFFCPMQRGRTCNQLLARYTHVVKTSNVEQWLPLVVTQQQMAGFCASKPAKKDGKPSRFRNRPWGNYFQVPACRQMYYQNVLMLQKNLTRDVSYGSSRQAHLIMDTKKTRQHQNKRISGMPCKHEVFD